MSSACSNPLLYGWLNENFKKEFRQLFSQCVSNAFVDCICRLKGASSTSSTPSAAQRSLPGSIKQKAVKQMEIIRDISSSRELDTLNSTSNHVFNYYTNDLSKTLNSSSSILNSKPNNLQLYMTKRERESIEQATEQTELISGQTTGQTELIISERKESSLNTSTSKTNGNSLNNSLTNSLSNVNNEINSVNNKINGTDLNGKMINKSTSSNSLNNLTIKSNSKINKEETKEFNKFIRKTHFKPEDLNRTESLPSDHTLYLNLDQNDDFNEMNKCTEYLSSITDAVI